MTSVATSNDIHIGKLLALEDEMRERFTKRYNDTINGSKEEEKQRNRARVDEIKQLLRDNREAIEKFMRDESMEDEYDDR